MLTAGDLRTVLIPTPVKTSAYTARHGDFVLVDTTAASVTITLPLNPPQNSVVGAKQVATAAGHTATVRAAGADAFNLQGGATTLTLTLLNQGCLLQYASGVWVVQSDDLPLGGLDARYAQQATALALAPAGATAETMPRWAVTGAQSAMTSGTLYLTGISIPAGVTVSNVTFMTSIAAKTGGTHGWYILCDSGMTCRAVTADQTDPATVWGATNFFYTLPVTAPYTTTYSGLYYIGVMVSETAGTMPTFNGAALLPSGVLVGQVPIYSGTSNVYGAGGSAPPSPGTAMTALSGAKSYSFYAYTS